MITIQDVPIQGIFVKFGDGMTKPTVEDNEGLVPLLTYHEEVEGSHFGNSYELHIDFVNARIFRQDLDSDTWEILLR